MAPPAQKSSALLSQFAIQQYGTGFMPKIAAVEPINRFVCNEKMNFIFRIYGLKRCHHMPTFSSTVTYQYVRAFFLEQECILPYNQVW